MAIRVIGIFIALAANLVAQGFAPASVANLAYTMTPTSAVGIPLPSAQSGIFTATGVDYTTLGTGFPLIDPVLYTWTKTGADTGRLTETNGTASAIVNFTFLAPNSATFVQTLGGTSVSGTALFSPIPQPPPPLVNLSTRASLTAGQILTSGFYVAGTTPRRVLIRGVGPQLANYSVTNPMPDPVLTVFSGQTQIGTNAGWDSSATLSNIFVATGAFALPPNSKDAALVLTLSPGSYTAQVRGNTAGEVLLEVYFVD
jgi:hypothetical protein